MDFGRNPISYRNKGVVPNEPTRSCLSAAGSLCVFPIKQQFFGLPACFIRHIGLSVGKLADHAQPAVCVRGKYLVGQTEFPICRCQRAKTDCRWPDVMRRSR